MSRPITERMSDALSRLDAPHWRGKRKPKAFYLAEPEFEEFKATDPPTVQSLWGNNPPQRVTDPAFRDVPVRLSTSRNSRLYDNTHAGRDLPK